MSEKKYYKLVRDNLRSFNYPEDSVYSKQYRINKFIYSSGGQFLFAFDSLESAEAFARHHCWCGDRYKIYECEVEGLQVEVPRAHSHEVWPKNTVWAYGIKLTQLVMEIEYD